MKYVFDPEILREVARSHRKHPPRTAAFFLGRTGGIGSRKAMSAA